MTMKKIFLCLLFLIQFTIEAKQIENFKLPEYDSQNQYDISKSKKKVVLNFWASWCTSCIKELDQLEALKKKYPHYEYIALNAGDTKKKIKRFLRKHPWSYKVIMDKDKSVAKGLGVLSLPQTWVIDEKGNIIYKELTPPKTLP